MLVYKDARNACMAPTLKRLRSSMVASYTVRTQVQRPRAATHTLRIALGENSSLSTYLARSNMIEEQTDREQENGDQGKNNHDVSGWPSVSCHVMSCPLLSTYCCSCMIARGEKSSCCTSDRSCEKTAKQATADDPAG